MDYLAAHAPEPGKHLPSLEELTNELDLGVGLLRFRSETARAMGLIEIHPGKGLRML